MVIVGYVVGQICELDVEVHDTSYFTFCIFSVENGYGNVRFHVVANLHSFSSEDETKITETVAYIIGCSTKDIQVNGYLHSTSFFIVLSINEIYIERLFTMKQHDKDKLSKLNIDFFKDDFKTITLERTTGDEFIYFKETFT